MSFPRVVMLIFQKQAAGAVPEHCSKTSWQILLKGDRDSQGFKRPLSKVITTQELWKNTINGHQCGFV